MRGNSGAFERAEPAENGEIRGSVGGSLWHLRAGATSSPAMNCWSRSNHGFTVQRLRREHGGMGKAPSCKIRDRRDALSYCTVGLLRQLPQQHLGLRDRGLDFQSPPRGFAGVWQITHPRIDRGEGIGDSGRGDIK